MLTIKEDKNYKSLAQELNVKIQNDAIVMVMKDSQIPMGLGAVRIFGEYAVIDDIRIKEEFRDFSLEYGMGKALLNLVDLRGVRHAVSDNTGIEKQLRALKFKSPSEIENPQSIPANVENCKLYLNLDGYFVSNC